MVNEHVRDYLNSLEPELPPFLLELERKAKMDSVPIIRKEAQALLRFLLVTQRPGSILEVGTAIGFSALFMSSYMPPECKITTIEKVPMRYQEASANFRRAEAYIGQFLNEETARQPFIRPKAIDLLTGDANSLLGSLSGSFDFIFLDAAKGQYMNFLPELLRLLQEGGMLVTDNVLQEGSIAESKFTVTRRDRTIHKRMREFLYALKHTEWLETVILPVGDGVAVSTKRSGPEPGIGR